MDLGVLEGDEDDPLDGVLHGLDIRLGKPPGARHELVGLGGLDHLVQLLLGHGDVSLGDLPQDLDVDPSETEGDDGSELGVADHGQDDLLAGDHLLDGDSVDPGSGHVLGAGLHDLGVCGLGLLGVLHSDDDSADIGLVLDVGGQDLHDHGVADLVALGSCFLDAPDSSLSRGGDAVGGEDLLSFGLGQGVPSLGPGLVDDDLGLLPAGDGRDLQGVVLHRGADGVLPEVGEGLDSPVGGVEAGESSCPEDVAGASALVSACETGDGGDGDLVLHLDEYLGDGLEVRSVQGGTHDDESAHLGVLVQDPDDLSEVLGLGVSADIDGVGDSGDAGDPLPDLLDGLVGELDGVDEGRLEGGVGGHDSESSGVGDDSDSVLVHRAVAAEDLERVEHLVQVERPVDVELVENDVVDSIGSCEGTGVRGSRGGSCLGPSGLEDHDGLLDGHVLDGLDELLSVGDSFAVHPDDLGVGVVGDLVDKVGLVDVRLVSECDEVGEPYIVAVGPVDDRGTDSSGLGEDGDVSGLGQKVSESRVDACAGVHVPETVGSEEPDAVFLGLLLELLLELGSCRAVLLESCGQDGGILNSGLAQVGHLAGDVCGLDRDDCEVDGLADLGNVRVRLVALDHPALGVDRVKLSLETGVNHILYEHSTELGLIVRSSYDCDRRWGQQ